MRSAPKRATELSSCMVLAVLCAASTSCGARSGVEPAFDASSPPPVDAHADDEPDARVVDAGVECPDQFGVVDWVLDGEAGSSGCVAVQGIINPSTRGRDMRCDPHLEINFWGFVDESLPLFGPSQALTAAAYNVPLVTGESGNVEPWSLGEGPPPCLDRRVVARLRLSTEVADYSSGTWHVLRGGGVGEWVDFELRDVVYDDVGGHRLVLERVHFHVRLYDPAVGP